MRHRRILFHDVGAFTVYHWQTFQRVYVATSLHVETNDPQFFHQTTTLHPSACVRLNACDRSRSSRDMSCGVDSD